MENVTKSGITLNGNQLKLIAIIAMTVDLVAWVVFPGYSMNPVAIPSHFAYLFCFGHSFIPNSIFNQTSVLWAFAGGLVALAVGRSEIKDIWKKLLLAVICIVTFPADWSCIAALVILSTAPFSAGTFTYCSSWMREQLINRRELECECYCLR